MTFHTSGVRRVMRVRVPLIRQPRGKPHCGIAASRMVLAYHGVHATDARLLREMDVRPGHGVRMFAMARWFLEHGFDARVVSWRSTYPASFLDADGDELRRRQLRWASRTASRFRRDLRRFLEAGGHLEPRPLTPDDLLSALARREPPLLLLRVARLWKINRRRSYHAVVLTGVSDERARINDPEPHLGGRVVHPLFDVLHACYVAGGGALFVSPR